MARTRGKSNEPYVPPKVDKGIPYSSDKNKLKSPWRALLLSLDEGDSFVVDGLMRAQYLVNLGIKRLGMSVASKQESPGVYRIWLLKKEARPKPKKFKPPPETVKLGDVQKTNILTLVREK